MQGCSQTKISGWEGLHFKGLSIVLAYFDAFSGAYDNEGFTWSCLNSRIPFKYTDEAKGVQHV